MARSHSKLLTHLWMFLVVALTGWAPACKSAGGTDSARSAQPALSTDDAERESGSPSDTSPPAAGAEISEDCDALALAWRREVLGEDEESDPELEQEIAAEAAKFPCELQLDLDGDGADERVFITSAGPERAVGIGIEWGDSHRTVLGAGTPVEIQPGVDDDASSMEESEFGWIRHWKPAPVENGAFAVQVLGNTVRFDPPGILGEGIQISGTDAAAIIYFDGSGWRWIHLGF